MTGIAALAAAAAAALSGIFLSFHYSAALPDAHESLAHLERSVFLGGFLRSLHHWSAQLAILLAILHGAKLFLRAAYKAPRGALWTTGVALFLALVALGYTGYLLPGDERAIGGLEVLAGVAGSVPLLGPALRAIALGGPAVSSATVARLHALHVHLLPLLLVALVALYLRLRSRLAGGGPLLAPGRPGRAATLPALAAWLAAILLALLLPVALGRAAAPGEGVPEGTRPEWFFLWVNFLLAKGAGGTFLVAVALPLLLAGILLALPRLAPRPGSRRPERIAAAALALALLALTAAALATAPPPSAAEEVAPAEEPSAARARDEKAAEVVRLFRCAGCHVIDGDPKGGDAGPPLQRAEARALYTEAYFRRKVGDPLAFWEATGMLYTPKSRKPTPEQLDILTRWFFGE